MDSHPLFSLGDVYTTRGVRQVLEQAGIDPLYLLIRHLCGDWGELCEGDSALNDAAVTSGERILSSYLLPTGAKVWIITDAAHLRTTLLLPDEY
jgi:hypothetical protein